MTKDELSKLREAIALIKDYEVRYALELLEGLVSVEEKPRELWLLALAPDTRTSWGFASGKIETIKALRLLMNLGLKEAKDVSEALPANLGIHAPERREVQELIRTGAVVEWR